MPTDSESSTSSSDNTPSSIKIEKLTASNWISWKSKFVLYLRAHNLYELFDPEWCGLERNQNKFKLKNYRALNALYQAVSKDLHNEILANDSSFTDAWNALSTACGQNSVVSICAAYREVNRMVYQPGTSLNDHISKFKGAYTRLTEQTSNNMQDFGTVTSFMAAAMFLESLENDTELTPIVQTCYDIRPFTLKAVTDRVAIEAVRRTNRAEHQASVMMTTQSNTTNKGGKKKAKSSDGQKPKAVAPTLNNQSQQQSSSAKKQSSSSNNKSTESVDQRFQRLENSVGELTELMKKFASTNMLGMVHDAKPKSTKPSGPFEMDSDHSNFFIATVQNSSREYFSRFLVFDTGATQSCVINLELLINVQPMVNHFLNTFSSPVPATHVGTLKLGDYHINPVYYVPSGCANILSGSQLSDHGLKPQFKGDQYLIKAGDKIVATFPRIGKLYLAPVSDYICITNMQIPSGFDWHFALGHASNRYVDLFLKQNNIHDATYTSSSECDVCMKVKIRRSPHSRRLPSSSTPFHRLHTDVLQITPVSKHGFRYILVVVDDASRFNRIYLLRSKSESENKLLDFISEIRNKVHHTPAYLHSDRGGEFSSTLFLNKLSELGVSIERGPADSPQTNGVAERFNGVLLDKIKCMLLQSQIPLNMWHEAALHASTVINILPHASLNWVSPTSILVKHNMLLEPDRTTVPLIPFGARVVVHRPENLKLNPRGVDHWFLGFEPMSDACRFLDPIMHRIVISRDYVIPSVEMSAEQRKTFKDVLTLPRMVPLSVTAPPKSARLPVPVKHTKKSVEPVDGSISTRSFASPENQPLQSSSPSSDESDSDVSFETEAMNVFQRAQRRRLTHNELNRSVTSTRPININPSINAQANQGRHFQLPAEDLQRLRPSWEWASEDHRPRREIRGDIDPANIVNNRRRAPQLPGGLDEQPDIVNLVQSVSMADAMSSKLEKPLWIEAMTKEHASQLTHFTGDLVPPPKNEKIIGGMWVLSKKLNEANEVIRHKARWVGFGNHQEHLIHYYQTYASVGRIETFKILLSISQSFSWPVFQFDVETAFLHGEMDAEVYVRQMTGFEVPGKEHWVWKLNKSLYGMRQAPRMWKQHLTKTLRNLGLVPSIMDDALFFNSDRTLFLHIYVDDGLINYIDKILDEFHMKNANSVKTPLPTNALTQVEADAEPFDAAIMQKAMGYLNYLAIHSRPDIVFACTKHLGLEISKRGCPRELTGFADADYAMSTSDKKSTTGFAIQFQGNLICWKSKKQSVVAQSTTEAEFIAINVCAKQIRWLKNLLIDMKIPVGVPTIRNDNSGAVIISQELRLSENSKHIEIRYQYLRDIVAKHQLRLADISTQEMIADIMTKPLGMIKVAAAQKQLTLINVN